MKRKDILADFSNSLTRKEPKVASTPPSPVEDPSKPVKSISPRPKQTLPKASPKGGGKKPKSGFQRITVSLTATDLLLADDKRFSIGQKHRVLLDRSKLLKVALRALDPNHPEMSEWISEVVDADLRKSKTS